MTEYNREEAPSEHQGSSPRSDEGQATQGQGDPRGETYQVVGYVGAPFGVDPISGLPYSDKSRVITALLQILLPFGIGRMYSGRVGLGVTQMLVTVLTCGAGGIWSMIDGIVILIGQPKDGDGRLLR